MSFNRSAQNVQLTGGNLIIVDTDKKIRSSKYEFADGGSDGAGTSVTLQDVTEQGASTDRTVTFSNVTTAFTTSSNVGIGTGNPGHKLDVAGVTRTSNIIVNSTNGSGSLSSGTLTLDFDGKSYKTFVVAAGSATISTVTIQNAIDGSQGVVDLRPRVTSDVDIFPTIASSTIKTSLYSNALINSASHCLISTFTLSGNTFVSFSEYT